MIRIIPSYKFQVPGGTLLIKTLWLLTAALLVTLMLSGCATKASVAHTSSNPVAALSPMPQSLADIPQRSVARVVTTLTVPAPLKSITLTWDYDVGHLWEVSHFRVYSTTNLFKPFTVKFATTNQTVSLIPTNWQEYFYVTAFGVNGLESLPNTK